MLIQSRYLLSTVPTAVGLEIVVKPYATDWSISLTVVVSGERSDV